jgi:primosomal protein N''
MPSIVSFEDRLAKIKTISDLDDQLRIAKAYVKSMRLKMNAASTLAEKTVAEKKFRASERVLRQLRMSYFDIEDRLSA